MNNSFQEITEAMLKIPGLKNLVIPVERIPSDAEFQVSSNQLMAVLDAENDVVIESDLDFDFAAPTPSQPVDHGKASPSKALIEAAATAKASYASATPTSGSKRITIRVPMPVLMACKTRARTLGSPYQTFINRTLGAAVRKSPPSN